MATLEDVKLWEYEQPWGVFFDGTVFSVYIPEEKRYKYKRARWLLLFSYWEAVQARDSFKYSYTWKTHYTGAFDAKWYTLINSISDKLTVYSDDGANKNELNVMKELLPECIVDFISKSGKTYFEASINYYHAHKSFKFTTKEEALKLADELRKANYTKKKGKACTEYAYGVPASEYQFDSDYISFYKGRYYISIPVDIRDNYTSNREYFETFKEAVKQRDEYKYKYQTIPYRKNWWAIFKHIEDELYYYSGENEYPPDISEELGCIDCTTRREHLSPETMSKNVREVERTIIKLSETNPELNVTKELIESRRATKNVKTDIDHINNVEDAKVSIEEDTKEVGEYKMEEVIETETPKIPILRKDCNYLILNEDTNTFCLVMANSTLDVLKELVKMNTDNVSVLKRVENTYVEVELLK